MYYSLTFLLVIMYSQLVWWVIYLYLLYLKHWRFYVCRTSLQGAVFANVEVGWKNVGNGQTKTWHQSMNLLTISLIYTSRCRLFGCSRLDNRDHWLDNLCDTFENHSQKHRCIHLVSCSLPWMPVVLHTYFCIVFF